MMHNHSKVIASRIHDILSQFDRLRNKTTQTILNGPVIKT